MRAGPSRGCDGANAVLAPGSARHQRRAHRALKIQRLLVFHAANFAHTAANLAPGFAGKQRLAPAGKNWRHAPNRPAASAPSAGASVRTGREHSSSDQRSSISQPILQLRSGLAQRGDRRHGVDDVAHGAQAHHQHALRQDNRGMCGSVPTAPAQGFVAVTGCSRFLGRLPAAA